MKEKKSLKLLIGGLCVIVFGFGFASILKNVGISYALTGNDEQYYYCPFGNRSGGVGTASIDYPYVSAGVLWCKTDNTIAGTIVQGDSVCKNFIAEKGATYGISSESAFYNSDDYTCRYEAIKGSCYLCSSSNYMEYKWGADSGVGLGSNCVKKSDYKTYSECEAANDSSTTYTIQFISVFKNKDSDDDNLWYLYKDGSNFNGVNLSYSFKSTSPLSFSKWSGQKDGFTFNGWDTASTCNNPQTTGTAILTDGKVFYACFTKNSGGDTPTPTTYKVTFNMQTGDVLKRNGTTQTSSTFDLSSINYSEWTATRSGSTFNGWATSTASCSNAKNSGSVSLSANVSLVPCFTTQGSSGGETGGDTPTPTTYKVTFNMQTGDVLKKNGTTQTSSTFDMSSINYSEWTAVREGATFLGWATSASSCANAVKSGSVSLTKAVSLVPCFEGGEYIVTFNMDDGDELWRDGLTQNTNTFKLDEIVFSDWEANRTGTTFLGWSENSACTAPIKSGTITLKRNMSFYPCFNGSKKYNVSFDVSGGTLYYNGSKTSTTKYQLDKFDYSKFKATKDGYIFNGWSTNSGCTTNGKTTGTVNIKSDTKYYACFSVDNNSSGGGTIVDNPKTGSTLFYAIIIIGGIALTYAIYNYVVLKGKVEEN